MFYSYNINLTVIIHALYHNHMQKNSNNECIGDTEDNSIVY